MKPRNAMALEPGGYRVEGRSGFSTGKSCNRLAPQTTKRLPGGLPDTAIAGAFLRALVRKAATTRNTTVKIVIPTGIVEVGELMQVLRALGLIPWEVDAN